jgi:hypothetical protein
MTACRQNEQVPLRLRRIMMTSRLFD